VAQGDPEGGADVVDVVAAAGRAGAAREALGAAAREREEQAPRHRPLRRRVVGEVLVAQELDLAPGRGDGHGVLRRLGRGRRGDRRHARAGEHHLRGVHELAEGVGLVGPAEGGLEGRVEGGEVAPLRAQDGPQGVVGGLAGGRIDGCESAVGLQDLPDPHGRPGHAHPPGERADPVEDRVDARLRHR
jgi:hypothetical protein